MGVPTGTVPRSEGGHHLDDEEVGQKSESYGMEADSQHSQRSEL